MILLGRGSIFFREKSLKRHLSSSRSDPQTVEVLCLRCLCSVLAEGLSFNSEESPTASRSLGSEHMPLNGISG